MEKSHIVNIPRISGNFFNLRLQLFVNSIEGNFVEYCAQIYSDAVFYLAESLEHVAGSSDDIVKDICQPKRNLL